MTGAATASTMETATGGESPPCKARAFLPEHIDGTAVTGAVAEENKARAEAELPQLLADMVLPAGAVEVCSDPAGSSLKGTGYEDTPELVDDYLYWRVSGEPEAVAQWIEAHPPAGAQRTGHGYSGGPGGITWDGTFSFTPENSQVIERETLQFGAAAAEGGGTALRADAQVVWRVPRSPLVHIPADISAVSVSAHGSEPAVSDSQTISEPADIHEMIALVEGLNAPGGGVSSCPKGRKLELELQFLGAGQAPAATAEARLEGCGSLILSVNGNSQALEGAGEVVASIESLLGVRWREPE